MRYNCDAGRGKWYDSLEIDFIHDYIPRRSCKIYILTRHVSDMGTAVWPVPSAWLDHILPVIDMHPRHPDYPPPTPTHRSVPRSSGGPSVALTPPIMPRPASYLSSSTSQQWAFYPHRWRGFSRRQHSRLQHKRRGFVILLSKNSVFINIFAPHFDIT